MTTTTPTPTKVYRTWFPAGANVPGQTTRLRGKVFVTDAGLYVFQNSTHLDEARPSWYSPVNFEETGAPATDYAALQRGWQITTEAGVVLVRLLGGCPCAFKRLKTWAPSWAVREAKWGE